VLATGIAVAVHRRRRAVEAGAAGYSAAPPADFSRPLLEPAVVAATIASGDTDRLVALAVEESSDVELVRWIGSSLARMCAGLEAETVSGVPLLVEVEHDTGRLQVFWTQRQPNVPDGWAAVDGGWSWVKVFSDDEAAAELASPLPALVTVGQSEGRQVLVDVESFGALVVTGDDPAQAADAIRSMMTELAAGDHVSDVLVAAVGIDVSALSGFDRVRPVDVEAAAELLKRAVDSCGEMLADADSLFAARLGRASLAVPSTVVFAAGLSERDRDRLVGLTSPGRGGALVIEGPAAAALQLHVTGERATLSSDGAGVLRRLDPAAALPAATGAAIAGLIERAAAFDEYDDEDIDESDAPSAAAEAAEAAEAPGARVATLGTFGDVVIDVAIEASAATVTHAPAAMYALAYASAPMSGVELAELTGYSARTFSTVFHAEHPLVERVDGRLRLRSGVCGDHQWLRLAVSRLEAEPADHGAAAEAWAMLSAVTDAPYARTPKHRNKRDPFAWVDEWPEELCARTQASQQLVEAALAYAAAHPRLADAPGAPSLAELVEVCCRLARIVPRTPVVCVDDGCSWTNSAHCLLQAAHTAAAGSREMRRAVQLTASRLIADDIIEASDDLAAALGL
jgi:hypothetical protein